ncbi:hypothetical protein COCOBI_10-0970 [Coccomyxa sp. Obi]|nr:hypothetical protein COCOBI_10-0970 [Coccomyxa sp. Obi]
MWKVAVLLFLLGSAGGVTPGLPPASIPIQVPSFAPAVAQAKTIAAAAPAVARSFGASVVGPSGVCRIPLNGGTLISCAPCSFLLVGRGVGIIAGAAAYAHDAFNAAAEGFEAGPVELGEAAGAAAGGGEVGLGVEIGVEAGLTVAEGAALAQTAQACLQLLTHPHVLQDVACTYNVDSIPLDLQEGDVATADASIKAAQNKSISNPVQLAMQAGKKQNPSAQAPLTAFQNILLLAPQQAVMAKAPNALPSAIQTGLSAPVNPSSVASGGRKMLQSAPDCCNTYTVKPGDTLTSIAQAYGQPTNGARIMQARTVLLL